MSYFNVNDYLKTRKLKTSLDVLNEIGNVSSIIRMYEHDIEKLNETARMSLRYTLCPNFKQHVDDELRTMKEDLDTLINVRQQLDKAYNRLFKRECVLKR